MTSSRLKIVQAAAFPFPSLQGSQVYVRGMSRALGRRGHDVVVACYGHGDSGVQSEDSEFRVVRTPRVPGYRRMRAGPDWVKPWLDVALVGVLARLMRDADLVHAHNYEAPLAAYLARTASPCPVIYNNHNTLGEELPQYFRAVGLQRAAGWAGRVLDQQIPRRADAAIAISEKAAPALEKLGCRRVHHVAPGVDPEDLEGGQRAATRTRWGLEGRPWVVYAGNPDAYQDLSLLLAAMEQVEHAGLLMVSASDPGPWEAACGLPPERRRFVQAGSWAETRNLLAAADVAALPRTRCTGFPIKLLNTLGMGLPTVCSAGSWQRLPGAVSVKNGDVDGFARELAGLCQDRGRRSALGEKAREHIQRECSWDARARELEGVYESVLAEG